MYHLLFRVSQVCVQSKCHTWLIVCTPLLTSDISILVYCLNVQFPSRRPRSDLMTFVCTGHTVSQEGRFGNVQQEQSHIHQTTNLRLERLGNWQSESSQNWFEQKGWNFENWEYHLAYSQSANFLRNIGFSSPNVVVDIAPWWMAAKGEDGPHAEKKRKKHAESCTEGKYFKMAAANTARAIGTLCLQFPGCNTCEVSFGAEIAWFCWSISWTLCSKLQKTTVQR